MKKVFYSIAFVFVGTACSFSQEKANVEKTDVEKKEWIKNNPEDYEKMVQQAKDNYVAPKKNEEVKVDKKELQLKPKSEDTLLLEKEIEENKNNPEYPLEMKLEKLRQTRKFEDQNSK